MLIRRNSPARRRGVAAVEMAVVLPILLSLIIGVWELGRIIQVTNLMVTAARDGARLAAQGTIINTTGAYTFIRFKSGQPSAASPPTPTAPADTAPYVWEAIEDSLQGYGIDITNANITFAF